jgi:hypothetical protein
MSTRSRSRIDRAIRRFQHQDARPCGNATVCDHPQNQYAKFRLEGVGAPASGAAVVERHSDGPSPLDVLSAVLV